MKQKVINSQLNNWSCYEMYKRRCISLAENVFEFKKLPEYIDLSYLNQQLLRRGSIAFFIDEELGLLALPYINISTLDVYGRPNKIQVIGQNGYTKYLNRGEFVIMYDNNGRYPLYLDICQYAERLALITRVTDINVSQQKTPRYWKTSTNKEKSLKDMLNEIDSCEETVTTYDGLTLEDTSATLAPAPFVTDKLDIHKNNIWSEFLQLIGISNLSITKKERNISDEISAMMGGTVASRFSRFEPRKRALEEIKNKWGIEIEITYYDGEPTTEENNDDFLIETESVENV